MRNMQTSGGMIAITLPGGQTLVALLAGLLEKRQISQAARAAYDGGVPRDQCPIYDGPDSWKASLWQDHWDWQRAYREGEAAHSDLMSPDQNPYRGKGQFGQKALDLEMAWGHGFNNRPELE